MLQTTLLRSILAAIASVLLLVGGISLPLISTPIAFLALGTSLRTAAVAAIVLFILMSVLLDPAFALAISIILILPSLWLARLTLLTSLTMSDQTSKSNQETSNPETSGQDKPTSSAEVEAQSPYKFYPLERLIVWATGMAIFLSILVFGQYANQSGGLPGVLVTLIEESPELIPMITLSGDIGDLNEAIRVIVNVGLIWFPSVWSLSILTSLYIAQSIAQWMGVNRRPAQTLKLARFPQFMDFLLLVSLIASFFLEGWVAILAGSITICLFMPYFLLGLSIIHAISHRWNGRAFVLGCLYVSILVLAWPILAVAAVGLLEPAIGLRQRFGSQGKG
jgi:hypothetical protein